MCRRYFAQLEKFQRQEKNMKRSDTVLLKFGVMTDNHLADSFPQNALRTERVFALFKQHDVDAVVNCGDIANRYQLEMLELHNDIFKKVFSGDDKPEKLWIAAGHDVAGAEDKCSAYDEVAEILDSGGLNFVKEINGFVFIGISQEQPWHILEDMLQKYYKNDTRPLFVITHEPPFDTVLKSEYSFFKELRNILNKYPQVVSISGHTHSPVFLDRNIWQGEFTAVNAGSLFYWKDAPVGAASRRLDSCDAMIFEIYDGKIVIRRFNMLSNEEIAPENPWILPLPFDRENAPFVPEVRAERFPVPEFVSGEGFEIVFDGEPFSMAYCKIPEILAVESFNNLRFELYEEQNGGMVNISVFDFCNDYRSDSDKSCVEIPVGLLKGNLNYHIKMTPFNLYGKAGKSFEFDFRTPASALQELPFDRFEGILKEDGNIYQSEEFATSHDMEVIHIVLKNDLQKFKNENIFTVIEIASEHADTPAILMAHGDAPDYGRHYLLKGKTAVMRHSFDLKYISGERLSVFLGEGTPGKYKIHDVKYYKIITQPLTERTKK